MNKEIQTTPKTKTIVKKCHCCGSIIESQREVERCNKCRKAFLPNNYFNKVHAKNSEEYRRLFAEATELHDEDLVRGLMVLW